MKNTLIVPFSSRKIYFGMLVTLMMTGMLILIFSSLEHLACPGLAMLMRIVLAPIIALFLFGLVYGLFWDLKKPAAILSPEGIWIKRFGLIPWHAIDAFNVYMIPTTPMEVLGIRLKNSNEIRQQSSFEGRCVLFWAKIFGQQYHITLSCLGLEDNEILAFSRQFSDKNF